MRTLIPLFAFWLTLTIASIQIAPINQTHIPFISAPAPTETPTVTPTATEPSSGPTPTHTPTVTPTATQPAQNGPCPCSGDTLNCSNFSTQSQAQACMDWCISQGAGDIHNLDGNADGEACESLPGWLQ